MIHKFWNVRLAPTDVIEAAPSPVAEGDPSASRRSIIREAEEQMEDKVYRIWSVLSTFEESSAACISDMLLHVSNGAYVDGVVVAEKFILHVEILFVSIDQLDASFFQAGGKGMKSMSKNNKPFADTHHQRCRTPGRRSCYARKSWHFLVLYQSRKRLV